MVLWQQCRDCGGHDLPHLTGNDAACIECQIDSARWALQHVGCGAKAEVWRHCRDAAEIEETRQYLESGLLELRRTRDQLRDLFGDTKSGY